MHKTIKMMLTLSSSLLMALSLGMIKQNIHASSIYGNWQHNITRRVGKHTLDGLKPYHKYTTYDQLYIKPGQLTWSYKPITQGWSHFRFRLRYNRRSKYYATSPDFNTVHLYPYGKNVLHVKGLQNSTYYRMNIRRKRYYRSRRIRRRTNRRAHRYYKRRPRYTKRDRRRTKPTRHYHIVVDGINGGWTTSKTSYNANVKILRKAIARNRLVMHDLNNAKKQHEAVAAKQNFLSQAKQQTFKDMNKDRNTNGIQSLTEDHQLDQLANIRAHQASVNFSHDDSNGESYSTLDAPRVGLPSDFECSENLADNFGSTGAEVANNAENDMMNHDADSNWGHRDNILNSGANYVGIGVAPITSGIYAGDYTIAEDFTANANNQSDSQENDNLNNYNENTTPSVPNNKDSNNQQPNIYLSLNEFRNIVYKYDAAHDINGLKAFYRELAPSLVKAGPSSETRSIEFGDIVNGFGF